METAVTYDSPVGELFLTANDNALTGLHFQKPAQELPAGDYAMPVFSQTKEWLDCYFSGKEPDFTPVLSVQDTPFRMQVWKLLSEVPYGHTMTYGQLARRTGIPNLSPQAVGNALNHNPIAILIPCHRIIGKDGSLIGYAGGLARKAKLLQLEGITLL